MIDEWTTAEERDAFLASSFRRQPYAQAGRAARTTARLDWATLDRVLASPLSPDVLTVAAGRLADVPAPRSADDVRRLMARGISTVVRASERHDGGLDEVARAFAAVLPGEVHVQLYATPAGTNSYGWHYDFEDVFIAQTLGIKDYYLRDNRVARHTRLGETLDFGCIRAETSPLMLSRLVAGDWLYVPRRWWHLVKCVEDSLSISVGVMPPEEARNAARIPRGWMAYDAAACSRAPGTPPSSSSPPSPSASPSPSPAAPRAPKAGG
jgi:hypothetical protein